MILKPENLVELLQQVSVMRNADDGALKLHQAVFENFLRFNIQVVGRLIQDQDIQLFSIKMDSFSLILSPPDRTESFLKTDDP